MAAPALARADMHVHTRHSRVNGDVPFLRSRDCYSDPLDVHRLARARGMDVVTITDHDSIDGWLELLSRRPAHDDILPGEEVSCWYPDTSLEIHLGVYGLTETHHRELQPLRRNALELMAYLKASDLFFAFNHPFHFYRHQIPLEDYSRLFLLAPAVEVRNGTMLQAHNTLVADIWNQVRGAGAPVVAGSDAHTTRRIARTWTEAPGRTAAEFLQSLRAGAGRGAGAHGGARAVAGDAYGVVGRYAASIFGYGPKDHSGWHRALCAACVVASPPAQFLPFAIAWKGKRGERRTVDRLEGAFAARGFSPAFAEPRS
jgi:predicted metal-dependent phosphoesterase TrpH